MKTRTLRNLGIGLAAILASAIGYIQWGGEPASAAAGNDEPPANSPAASSSGGGAAGAAAPLNVAGANVPGSATSRKSGLGTSSPTSPGAKETRPLTHEETEKVAAAMTAFKKKLDDISPRGRVLKFVDNPTTTNTVIAGKTGTAAPTTLSTTILPPKATQGDVSVDAQFISGSSLTIVADPAADNAEVEQIAAASKGLSEVLQQFEAGSPAWKEARRQGEGLMAKMNTGKTPAGHFMLKSALSEITIHSDAAPSPQRAEIQILKDGNKPAGQR